MSSGNSPSSSSLRDRENIIPESPQSNGFPEPAAAPLQTEFQSPVFRRARAGTVPSRFSPGGVSTAPPTIPGIPSTSRPSPAPSPFQANNSQQQQVDIQDLQPSQTETKLRLRSGSLNIPPRTNYVSAFGPSIFASSWSQTRERSQTNSGLPQIPASPAYSSFSKDDEGSHMAPRTLDYLGLVDTPQTSRATLARPIGLDTLMEGQRAAAMQPFLSELNGMQRNLNRIRSYSVNAKEKYAADEEEEEESRHMYSAQHSGTVTPQGGNSAVLAAAQASAAAHAMAVAAYANNMTPSRPRARTAGVLDSPPINRLKSYLATPSKLDSMTSASDLRGEYFDISSGLEALKFAAMNPRPSSGEGGLASIEESQLEGPTRSLWLGNIPASTTTTSLIHIFQPFGSVESARVLTHKNCGFINYTTAEHAIQARIALNGKEIFPGAGPTRIGFAKPSSSGSNGTPTPNGGAYGSPSPDPNTKSGNEGGVPLSKGASSCGVNGSEGGSGNVELELPKLADLKEDILNIVEEFGAEKEDIEKISKCIDQAVSFNSFEPEIPTIPEPSHNRTHDAPKLRDIRKRIDNGNCSTSEIEEIALAMLPEVAELSSDYLGNTVIQKLFEYCSEEVKETMLVEIGPHLAEIGIHKNGTWAGQKIIDVAKTPAQMNKITDCLRPYTIALFLDQYGNYVLQCCLRFGAPYNDYIFETMLSRMWEISQGRFGSRAMRACLESHHANKSQQRMLAAAIALHSVQLATNANGALLLTWFLDTCNFPKRRTVLAPRLVPHLVHLCTHKVAYLTVLKVINQKNEPEARDTILKALFFSPGDKVLEDILKDHQCGATLIFKVLTTPFFEESMRPDVMQNVRNVLLKLKATPSQGYKRLMDEVGLSTRNPVNSANGTPKERDSISGGISGGAGERRCSHHNSNSNTPTHGIRNLESNSQAPFYTVPPMYDPAVIAGQFDPQTLRALEQINMYNTAPPAIGLPAFQYQLLQQQMAGRGAPGFFPMPGFNNPQGAPEQFRGATQGNNPLSPPGMGSPMLPSMGVGPGFNPLVAQQLMGGYGYGGMNGMPMFPQQQQQQQQQAQQHGGNGGGRRGGRVSFQPV
ncbi:ARM repeat-containing protein [Wilcoxina mikolae CBS 423.85]|nr:ARM repeat-containing protein [Wilcoxina mikolae CBS 423.85]